MKQRHSWEITDEFWEIAQPLIPQRERDPTKEYQRKPGGGRPPMESRTVLEAIFFVLRTGIQWKALPRSFGASSSVHRYFMFWCEQGFFQSLLEEGLSKYDEVKGIDWTWLSADRRMSKAPLARESVGRNPKDRGKNGSKRHLLVDGSGTPLSLVATGANRHDVSELEAVLDGIVFCRPDIFEYPQHLCLDACYVGEPALETIVLRGFIPHVISRGEERREKER